MRILRTLALSQLAALGAFALAGCASSPGQRATGQVIDDGSITARVKTAIAKDASIGTAMNVNVTTYRGVVQLSGFVDSEENRRRAGEIAQGVDGVRSVKNDLKLTTEQRG